MCAIFRLKIDTKELKKIFKHSDFSELKDEERIVYPSHNVFVIEKNSLLNLKWGIIIDKNKKLINIRSETLKEKFPNLSKSRCVIPIYSFYEWTLEKETNKKCLKEIIPYPQNLSFLACVFDKDNKTFAVLTTNPSTSISHIHHRMPVVLNGENALYYLEGYYENLSIIKDFKVI